MKMKRTIKVTLDKTFLKFIIVGVANTVVGTAIMFCLYNLAHCNYWISSAANYVFGSVLSYFLNKYFTFQKKEKSVKIVFRFITNISICYLIAYGLAKPLVRLILTEVGKSLQENVSMIVGMGTFVILNYIGQRFWTFKKEK